MHIEVSSRHGDISEATRDYIVRKSEKLLKYFERVTQIDVVVDHEKPERINVEMTVDAEHKHDFVAHDVAENVGAAFDQTLHKMEQQIKRYKEKLQDHRRDIPMGDLTDPLPEDETLSEG